LRSFCRRKEIPVHQGNWPKISSHGNPRRPQLVWRIETPRAHRERMKQTDAKRETASEIARRLREAGFQAYFVGGCVRDLVMGREPADYDITTDASPEQVVKQI